MSDLAIELLLVLLLATAIGWCIGRFFCKNREYEERAQKQKLIKKLATQEAAQKEQYQHLTETNSQLNQHKVVNAELEQIIDNLQVQTHKLREERKTLLGTIQELKVSHNKLQTLSSEFDANKQKLQAHQVQKLSQRNQIEKLEENTQNLTSKLRKTEQQLSTAQEDLSKALQENKFQKTNITEMEQDRRQLAKLSLDYEEVCTRLKTQELDRVNMHKNYAELKKEYQQLHLQCETMHYDSLQSTERYNQLSMEKEKATREVEYLQQERHTYQDRLRAISNVVNIVESEQVTAEQG